MATAVSEVEHHLAVGLSATVQSVSESQETPRYRTSIRGWQRGQYIIVDRPMVVQRYVTLPRDEPCAVRFLSEGVACGYEGAVLDLGPRSLVSHMYVSWPNDLRRIQVRKHERVKTVATCSVKVINRPQPVTGEIRDVSVGGCALFLPTPLTVGTHIRIWATLPDGAAWDGVSANVRRIRPTHEGALHGCRFENPAESLKTDLQLFVADALERIRVPDTSACRVMVMDPNLKVADAIREELSRNGYQVTTAQNLVEAFYRLRASYPHAVLVNQDQKPLSGVEICRLVKNAHAHHNVPILIYGQQANLDDAATDAGAVGYFPANTLIQNVAKLIRPAKPPETS